MFSNNIKFENLDALNREVFSSAEEVDNIADYVSTGSIICREDGIRLLVLETPQRRDRAVDGRPRYIITCYSLWRQQRTILSCGLGPADKKWLVGVITNGKKYRQR